MAKLREEPIKKEDIKEYLDSYSDFSFEVSILQKLCSQGFKCDHSGTYVDPISSKVREFDIRARKQLFIDSNLEVNISFSIECKNLRPNFPLLIHCMPRQKSESWLDLIRANKGTLLSVTSDRNECPYIMDGWVGKSCDQIGRRYGNDNEIIGNDADVFGKISQAISSSCDLLKEACHYAERRTQTISLVVPILVVPDNMLWRVLYSHTGEISSEPCRIENVEYYINKEWILEDISYGCFPCRVSHIDIVQSSNLEEAIKKYTEMLLLDRFYIENKLKRIDKGT